MRVLGIEFDSQRMNYVLLNGSRDTHAIDLRNRIELGDTRSRDALVAFQMAIVTVYNNAQPDVIAIKIKPESGRLRAGAAALKMEAVALANAPCRVAFISGQRINQCAAESVGLAKYLEPAFKAAVVAMD